MSIEEAMMGGIVFKGKKEKPKEENKIKTKAKKKTYITGLHGSGAAKMKAEIRRKRANSCCSVVNTATKYHEYK